MATTTVNSQEKPEATMIDQAVLTAQCLPPKKHVSFLLDEETLKVLRCSLDSPNCYGKPLGSGLADKKGKQSTGGQAPNRPMAILPRTIRGYFSTRREMQLARAESLAG
jgi:hypothetical protein